MNLWQIVSVQVFQVLSNFDIKKRVLNLSFAFYNNFNQNMNFYKKSYSLKHTPIHAQIIYPQDIQCIIQSVNGTGGVYIGNLEAAQNLRTLQKYNIKAVLTAASEAKVAYDKKHISNHLIIPALDHQLFPIEKFFAESYDFIDKHLQSTNILVHCMAGISRSVSLFIAYLIRKKKISYEAAHALVKSKRKIIYPNQGFVKQLKKFAEYHKEKKEENPRSYSGNFFNNPEEKSPYKNTNNTPTKPITLNRQYNLNSPIQQIPKPLYNRQYSSPYFEQQTINRYRRPQFKNQKDIDTEIQKIKKKYALQTDLNLHQKPYYDDYQTKTQKKSIEDYRYSIRNYGLIGRDKIFSTNDEPFRLKYRNYH